MKTLCRLKRVATLLALSFWLVAYLRAEEVPMARAFQAQSAIDAREDTRIPPGSKVYINSMNGFETYLVAAFEKKKVPLVVVTESDKADFEITGTSESQRPGWAAVLVTGQTGSTEDASISVQSIKTGAVVFAYAVHKVSAVHGKQSTAEACAKHLKQEILSNK